jgi:hypothetical protein
MNDLTIALTPSLNPLEDATRYLSELAEASARSSELLAQSMTLREIASDLLRDSVKAAGVGEAFGVSSPDAIFFNMPDSDQRIRSVALPDLLVDTMRHGVSVLQDASASFFIRHDSLEAEHAISPALDQALKQALTRFSRTLSQSYQAHLDASWRKPFDNPQRPQSFDTIFELLAEQQRFALDSEIALCGLSAMMSDQEQERLAGVVAGRFTDGVFGLACTTAENLRMDMPSTYVVSESVDAGGQPAGAVFLIMPAYAIERFETVGMLREALSGRLAGPLCQTLAISDQLQLGGQVAVAPDAWIFDAVNDSLINAHVHGVRHKQIQDCQFLLAQQDDGLGRTAFYAQMERVQTCAHLDEAMGQRFRSWVTRLNERAEPHWRKFADDGDKEHLLRLEQAHDERKRNVDETFGSLQSLETFALAQINHYIQQRLGRAIDPDLVRISLQDTIALGPDDSLEATYEHSLLTFAVQGLPQVTGQMRFTPSPDQLHAGFSASFITNMLQELDLHHRYEETLKQLFDDERTLRALAHHRDSAIALGAFAARMQGHLLQDRSHDLVHLIRGDERREGAVHSIGSLHLSATDSRFRDVIVFEERTRTDEHFVMYAPGAPNGRDFFEFGSWRQLSLQVGEWLATESGRGYVHDQLSGPAESGVIAVLNNVQLKPAYWGAESCHLVHCGGENFERNLTSLVRLKALSAFAPFNGKVRPAGDLPSYADASVLALVNARITALNTEFARLSPGLMSLRDYVHGKTTRLLNDYLRSKGYTRHVDPDTLYLGLGVPFSETPDFGEHSDLRSLTDLMMFGSEDVSSYRPLIHLYSSVGLDVARFPTRLLHFIDKQIREADLGARYMDHLQDEFLGRNHPLYERRKALMANRIQYEMIGGALASYHRGDLTLAQYAWLRQAVSQLSAGAPETPSVKDTAVSLFKIGDQIIEGVYIFRDFATEDPEYNVLYTPGAPDGRDFRPLSDYARLLDSAQMQNYYASRVANAGHALFGEFLETLVRGGKHDPDFIRIRNRPENRVVSADQLYGDMFGRMILDVDSQTESLAEKRLALAWSIIKWTGTIVLLPFPYASFGWGVLTTTVTFIEAFDAYATGDRATAIPLFVAGALGVVSGVDATRALIMGGHGLARIVATRAGLWVWKKLDLSATYRLNA